MSPAALGLAVIALAGCGASHESAFAWLHPQPPHLTPRQGGESLSDWPNFRVRHNAEEGDHAVTRLAAASDLRFLTGHGSCVEDSYATISHARFTEIACLIAGRRTESVIVGAAPPDRWRREAAVIERAIDGVKT